MVMNNKMRNTTMMITYKAMMGRVGPRGWKTTTMITMEAMKITTTSTMGLAKSIIGKEATTMNMEAMA